MLIKILRQEDWQQWKQFRLEALQNSPENFGSSFEEESQWLDVDFKKGLTDSDV